MKRTPPNKPRPDVCEVPGCQKAPTRVLGGFWFCDEHGSRDYERGPDQEELFTGGRWVAVRRNYHGEEAGCLIRWVVHREGELRGICECWDEESAKRIADLLDYDQEMRDGIK